MLSIFKKKKSTKSTLDTSKQHDLLGWLDGFSKFGTEEEAKTSRESIKKSRTIDLDYNALIKDFVKGVVGEKVVFQSNIKDNKELNDNIESWWSYCDEIGNCDVTEEFHYNGLIRQMAIQWASDGGFIIRTHYNYESWDTYLRFELIGIGRIDTSKGTRGREFNSWGATKSIHILGFNGKSVEVKADELIIFIPKWIDIYQQGAVSELAAIESSIDAIKKYTDAEVKQATNRARNGTFWISSIFSTLLDEQRKINISQKNGDTKQVETLKNARDKVNESAYKGDGLTPLPYGDDVKFDHQTPSSTFKELTSHSKGKMAASIGKSSALVYFDIGDANYSSLKAALQSSEITSGIDFDDLFNRVLKKMKELQIEAGVAIGELKIDDYNQSRRKYHKVSARRTNKIDIEPVKTANANKQNVEGNHVSKKDIANQYGKDAEQVIDDNLELELYEREKRKALKLDQVEEVNK